MNVLIKLAYAYESLLACRDSCQQQLMSWVTQKHSMLRCWGVCTI